MDHPLRAIREIAKWRRVRPKRRLCGDVRVARTALFPAGVLHTFYTIRSERQLMERLKFNLLYRWIVGLGIDYAVWITRCSPRTGTDGSENAGGSLGQNEEPQAEKGRR
jgi:transposase